LDLVPGTYDSPHQFPHFVAALCKRTDQGSSNQSAGAGDEYTFHIPSIPFFSVFTRYRSWFGFCANHPASYAMGMGNPKKAVARMHGSDPLLQRHDQEMARAASAAMTGRHAEAQEICSELITSGLYGEMESAGHKDAARRAKAEARVLLGSAMHYNDAPYEDIIRVLTFALDSPVETRKDALFTMAVVHFSFGHLQEAEAAMERCRVELASLISNSNTIPSELSTWREQDHEAKIFLEQLKNPTTGKGKA
jgi:hypothetical protein